MVAQDTRSGVAATVVVVAVLVAVLQCAAPASAFYLPGVPPQSFPRSAPVPLLVNKIESTQTQLSYSYYSLPFCQPAEDELEEETENLGEVLAGDRLTSSKYELLAKTNEFCKVLCRKEYTADEGKLFATRVQEHYTVDWVLDNLPAAVRLYSDENPNEVFYEREFPLGFDDKVNHAQYLFNHIRFTIKHNPNEDPAGTRIVGFEVEMFSVKHKYEGVWSKDNQLDTCNDAVKVNRQMAHQRIDQGGEVIFTYDVRWEESDTPWSTRWAVYNKLANSDEEIHWLSIVNSVLIVLFLTGMIAMILMRSLYKDIAKYNAELTLEEQSEETGWKLVHGDVFRAPTGTLGPMTLSVCVGSGLQLVTTALAVMVFACFGFLSPANRGGMVTAILLLYVFMGSFSGYFSARVYKMYNGEAWKRNTLITSTFFPACVGSIVFIINLFVWGKGSSQAIPFGTMFALLVLWVFVSVPLCFLGAFFGFRKDKIKLPVRTNDLPRHIPPQPWYLTSLPSVLVGGVLPFGAVFIELFFIMSSIWLHQTYVLFGFLMLVLVIVLITCAEIAIVMTYLQLCSEDWKWSWRSFVTPGASALYLFLYSIVYFATKLEITQFVSALLYFGYMSIISVTFFLMTGSVGYLACLLFVRKIYGAIKVD